MSRSSSNSSSTSSVYSDSSSLVYGHEPFSTFTAQVLELCRSQWPDARHDATEVTRMTGGGYNRIIGLSIVHSDEVKLEYILRVPRYESADVEREVALLRFVKENSQIPVPEVVLFDSTNENVLKDPYMIQRRVPGGTLLSTFQDLNYEEKRVVTRELAQIYRQIQQMRSKVPGILLPTQDNGQTSTAHATVQSFDRNDEPTTTKLIAASPEKSCLDTLVEIFYSQKPEGMDEMDLELARRMTKIATEMDELGYLDDNHISLAHLDFAPRNILINSTSPRTISAVLDWDSAIFLPRLMSCTPPLWIWAWKDDEEEDERLAAEIPDTAEQRELKLIFDETAGPEYVRYAYQPQYRMLRFFCQYALKTMHTNEEYYELVDLIKEWAPLKLQVEAQTKVGFPFGARKVLKGRQPAAGLKDIERSLWRQIKKKFSKATTWFLR